jgi:hypothetical protein
MVALTTDALCRLAAISVLEPLAKGLKRSKSVALA